MFLQPSVEEKTVQTLPTGLVGRDDAITRDQERQLLAYIDGQPWNCELKRRTQHYGYKYSYVGKPLEKVQPIPLLFLDVLGSSDAIKALFDGEVPNQVIVNEYIQDRVSVDTLMTRASSGLLLPVYPSTLGLKCSFREIVKSAPSISSQGLCIV